MRISDWSSDVCSSDLHKIGVRVGKRLAHAFGVLSILAENDGFIEVVGGFQKFRDLRGHQFGALIKDQRTVEIPLVVNAVIDFVAITVPCSRLRSIAGQVLIEVVTDDLDRKSVE